MLVLSRGHNQQVVVTTREGDRIWVTVRVDGGKAKLVFQAPAGVVIDRAEIDERKQAERAAGQCH